MKKLIALFGGVALVAVSLLTAFGFSDVTQDDFYFDAVSYLEDEGLVIGYSDGTFGYLSEINRAELITLVVRAKFVLEQGVGVEVELDPADCGGDIFIDVEEDDWYAGSVCYAKLSGWIEGYDDGSFDPTRDVNFVEVLKISMIAFGIDYDNETTPWYKGFVEAASEKNLIPLTIDSFGKKVSRGEMADLIARVLKYNAGELDEFLGDKADCIVTYETIEAGIDMSVECGGVEVGLGGGGGDDDCDGPGCGEAVCTEFSPYVLQCANGIWADRVEPNCEFEVCTPGEEDGNGPLYVSWYDPVTLIDHYVSKVEDDDGTVFTYSNELFSFEIDSWADSVDESTFYSDLVSLQSFHLDTFDSSDECPLDDLSKSFMQDFSDMAGEEGMVVQLALPVFDDWLIDVVATANLFNWDIFTAQNYLTCLDDPTLSPLAVFEGAILWMGGCPPDEENYTPEEIDFCSDFRGGIMSQINPDLMGDQ
jgi:hypothetical protein